MGGLLFLWRRYRAAVKAASESTADVATAADDQALCEKYKNFTVPADECRQLLNRLNNIMEQDRMYTNPDLKIEDLATAVGVSSHTLSYVFSQYLKRNYYDYINDYRISEFKRLVNNGDHMAYTLDALMKICGFNSRTTFFRYFKKVNGTTPSKYIKTVTSRTDA